MGNEAKRLMITADGGGSNGSRLRLWKLELQKLADETGLAIAATPSRDTQMEQVIVSLIAATTIRKGLKVHAEIDDRSYPAGIKVPDEEMVIS